MNIFTSGISMLWRWASSCCSSCAFFIVQYISAYGFIWLKVSVNISIVSRWHLRFSPCCNLDSTAWSPSIIYSWLYNGTFPCSGKRDPVWWCIWPWILKQYGPYPWGMAMRALKDANAMALLNFLMLSIKFLACALSRLRRAFMSWGYGFNAGSEILPLWQQFVFS